MPSLTKESVWQTQPQTHLPQPTPSPQTILNAIVGGLVGGVAGCTAGSAFGDALDQAVLDNYECLDCGYSFSCFSHSLRSS